MNLFSARRPVLRRGEGEVRKLIDRFRDSISHRILYTEFQKVYDNQRTKICFSFIEAVSIKYVRNITSCDTLRE